MALPRGGQGERALLGLQPRSPILECTRAALPQRARCPNENRTRRLRFEAPSSRRPPARRGRSNGSQARPLRRVSFRQFQPLRRGQSRLRHRAADAHDLDRVGDLCAHAIPRPRSGLVGLAIALPVVLLSLPAGHMADRYSRKAILLCTQAVGAVCSLALALISWYHLAIPAWPILQSGNAIARRDRRHLRAACDLSFHGFFAAADLLRALDLGHQPHVRLGGARARIFRNWCRAKFSPTRSPGTAAFSRSARSSDRRWRVCFSCARGFPSSIVLDAFCALTFFALVVPIKSGDQGGRAESNPWASLVAGMRFVLSKKVILATITLDMVAVLLGGATALLPIFADQILHCGTIGLGWMRAAPGDRRFRHGDPDRLSPADETRRQNAALGGERFRAGHDRVRALALALVFARRCFF